MGGSRRRQSHHGHSPALIRTLKNTKMTERSFPQERALSQGLCTDADEKGIHSKSVTESRHLSTVVFIYLAFTADDGTSNQHDAGMGVNPPQALPARASPSHATYNRCSYDCRMYAKTAYGSHGATSVVGLHKLEVFTSAQLRTGCPRRPRGS